LKRLPYSACARCRSRVIRVYGADDENVRLLASAAETPSASQAITAVCTIEAAGREYTIGHNGLGNGRDQLPRLRPMEIPGEHPRIERDHHVPAGGAIRIGDLFNCAQRRRDRGFSAPKRGRETHGEETSGAQRINHRCGEAAAPFGFVGVSANQGGQLFSTDYRVNGGDAGARCHFSARSRVPPPGILKSDA
jgi:hypothetical protein